MREGGRLFYFWLLIVGALAPAFTFTHFTSSNSFFFSNRRKKERGQAPAFFLLPKTKKGKPPGIHYLLFKVYLHLQLQLNNLHSLHLQ